MNGRVAKKLRKKAYGDKVTKASARKYGITAGCLVCTDDRTTYQDSKKEYYRRGR